MGGNAASPSSQRGSVLGCRGRWRGQVNVPPVPPLPLAACGRGYGNPGMRKVGRPLLVQWFKDWQKADVPVALSPMAVSRSGHICVWVGRVSAAAGTGHGVDHSAREAPSPASARRKICFWNPRCPAASHTALTQKAQPRNSRDRPRGGMLGVVPTRCRWFLFSLLQPRAEPGGAGGLSHVGKVPLPHSRTHAVLPCGRAW